LAPDSPQEQRRNDGRNVERRINSQPPHWVVSFDTSMQQQQQQQQKLVDDDRHRKKAGAET